MAAGANGESREIHGSDAHLYLTAVSLRTVQLRNGPVDGQLVGDFKDERGGVRRVVLIHSRHHQPGSFRGSFLTYGPADRDHLRGEVIGLLQSDGHCNSGRQASSICTGEHRHSSVPLLQCARRDTLTRLADL